MAITRCPRLQQALAEGLTDEAVRTSDQHRNGTLSAHAWPSPIRQYFRPAAVTTAGSTTERASKTQAG